MKRFLATVAILLLPLAACGEPSQQELLSKADNASNKSELVAALGDPTTVTKIGPVETWTYNAENGVVTFVITGDNITLKTAGSATQN